ncbi:HNH endonuclease isoform 2 [Gossypium australe]|uniref:HNH endonuclease isoform 2 n=1 Tax=Gossypium australe TaxID=47621 RepID=A0A5B6URB7_9ROSI|nr:HNH endonuclease isoform 2 [Gossypium australe]
MITILPESHPTRTPLVEFIRMIYTQYNVPSQTNARQHQPKRGKMIIDGKYSKTKRQSKSRPSSPRRSRSSKLTPPSASLVDGELSVTEQERSSAVTSLFEGLQISQDSNSNPRSFPYSVKQQCWEKAEKVKGRDPDRWRRDAVGNIVFRKLVGCPGCLCHDYDHIIPYSKGGKSTLENCQVLQECCNLRPKNHRGATHLPLVKLSSMFYCLRLATLICLTIVEKACLVWKMQSFRELLALATVNRSKGNRTELSRADLIQKSSYCRVSGRDMDLIELSAYGNVHHAEDSGGCRIQ